jgi:hypothetical protein
MDFLLNPIVPIGETERKKSGRVSVNLPEAK